MMKIAKLGLVCLAAFSSMAFATDRPRDFVTAEIRSISPKEPEAGNIEVVVTYLRNCNETFRGITTLNVPPEILARPNLAVGVVLERYEGMICAQRAIVETASFSVANIAGEYEFYAIQR